MAPITKPWVLLAFALCLLAACDSKEEEAAAVDTGPLLGALELPVSLRRSDALPGDAAVVESSTSEVRAAGKTVATLAGGEVPAADLQADVITKLKAALTENKKAAVALELHAGVPYKTVAQILNTVQAAGISTVAFKVRGGGGPDQVGYLAPASFTVGPRSKDDVQLPQSAGSARPWSDFVGVWEAMESGCRGASTGSCAYKPEKIAEGGELKLVLFAAGEGVNVNVTRIGPAQEPVAEEKAPAKAAPTDPAAEVEEEEPATEASFQFRSSEAVTDPSPVSATLKPLCGDKPCFVIVRSEAKTLVARVLSLLGAGFPDGAAAPKVHFELP